MSLRPSAKQVPGQADFLLAVNSKAGCGPGGLDRLPGGPGCHIGSSLDVGGSHRVRRPGQELARLFQGNFEHFAVVPRAHSDAGPRLD